MTLESITFRNYRSFGSKGATLELNQEFLGIVGVNNSGKSSLLRAFYELRPTFIFLRDNFDASTVRSMLKGNARYSIQLDPGERIFPDQGKLNESARITLRFSSEDKNLADINVKELTLLLHQTGRMNIEIVTFTDNRISEGIIVSDQLIDDPSETGGSLYVLNIRGNQVDPVNINWRALLPHFSKLANSMYIGPFRNAINSGGASYYDLAIGKDFISQFNIYKTGPDFRANQAVQAMSDAIAEIFGISRMDISSSSDGATLRYMVDGSSYRASELGAGIAQFVIVAANVLVKKPDILLIDEPELSLHASLQMRFLTLLAQYTNGPVIFASHSLGLTKAVADTILVASRNSTNVSVLNDYKLDPNVSLTLGELGYNGLHDATYKAVLLVEGVTEVRVFQEFLIKYGVRNEVAIVQLGGNGMATGGRSIELSELRKLSDKVFAIVDSERGGAQDAPIKPRVEFEKDCKDQGIDCLVLERRATENYLDQSIAGPIMNIPDKIQFGHYDKPPLGWSKDKNWRVAQVTSRQYIKGTDLDLFLREVAVYIKNS